MLAWILELVGDEGDTMTGSSAPTASQVEIAGRPEFDPNAATR